MNSKRVTAKWVSGLAVVLLAATGCATREIKITDAQMNDLIRKNVPIGSTISQVEAFVSSINIDSVKAFTLGYMDGSPRGTDELKGQSHKVMGYLNASLPKVGSDQSKFQVYSMRIVFYFGSDQRLLDYKVQTLGDW